MDGMRGAAPKAAPCNESTASGAPAGVAAASAGAGATMHWSSQPVVVPHPAPLAGLVLAVIASGLWIDRAAGFPGQVAVSLVVWLLVALLCIRLPAPLGRRLIACVWISALGEIIASLVWGLYDYQFGNLPLFVPPGHALLYLLGLILARVLDHRIALLVPLAAAPLVIALAWSGQDWLSVPLFALFLLFIRFGRQKRLYAIMFVLALVLELYGTALGNWAWRPVAPGTGLVTLNPPLAAGVFYCALDWLVNRFVGALRPAAPTIAGNHAGRPA